MKNFNIFNALMVLAIFLFLAGCNLKKTEKITDIPVTTQSKEAKAFVEQGLACYDVGEYQKAKEFFIKALGQDPNLGIAYLLKAMSSRSTKEFEDNLNNAKTNLEGASDWEKWYYEFFVTFLNGDYTRRIGIAETIVATYPDAARAQVDLGGAYQSGNQNEKARDCYQKAVEINPKWIGGYYSLGMSYLFYDPKDFNKAEENVLKVVEMAPSSSGAEIALGDCYRAQNNLEKARDAYSKAIELNPIGYEAYYKKGHANTFLGNFDEARQDYAKGGKHADSRFGSVLYIACTYLYGGDYNAAIKYLTDEAAKEDVSGDSKDIIQTFKMNCFENSSTVSFHFNEVARLKELIAQMEPLTDQIISDLQSNEAKLYQKSGLLMWQALLLALEGQYDKAKAKAEEIKTTLEPINDPTKLNSYESALGYICFKEKKYADAVSHFEKTQQDYIYMKYWLARAYEASGDKEKSIKLYKEIADYNFNDIGYAVIRNEVKKKLESAK